MSNNKEVKYFSTEPPTYEEIMAFFNNHEKCNPEPVFLVGPKVEEALNKLILSHYAGRIR